jgi:hypothetical protein
VGFKSKRCSLSESKSARSFWRVQPEAAKIGISVHAVEVKDVMLAAVLKHAFADVLKAKQEDRAALERARGESASLRNLDNTSTQPKKTLIETRSNRGLRRFQLEVLYYGNSYYTERIAQLETALSKKPRLLQLDLAGLGEISADATLRIRAVLMAFTKDSDHHKRPVLPARRLGACLAAGRQPDH